MGNKLPSWLAPRLDSVPEPFTVARARLAGQARAKKCTAATLSRIGRQGGRAAFKALTPEQRREKAQMGGRAANLARWGWSKYKLSGLPIMTHRCFQVLEGLEKNQGGMYPVQLWRQYVVDGSDGAGFANQVFRKLFRAGLIVRTEGKSPYGRPLYVISQAGRDALAGVRALIVKGPHDLDR